MPQRYEVVGTQPILNHQPGEVFEADIPDEQEQFLIAIGGLAKVAAEPPKEKAKPWGSSLTPR